MMSKTRLSRHMFPARSAVPSGAMACCARHMPAGFRKKRIEAEPAYCARLCPNGNLPVSTDVGRHLGVEGKGAR